MQRSHSNDKAKGHIFMHKIKQFIWALILAGLFSTTNALPVGLNTGSFSINSSVASLMDWYAQLLSKDSQSKFLDYYPKEIQQIKIIKIKLIDSKQENRHKFNVELLLTYKNANKLISKTVSEVLVFLLSPLGKPELNKIIKDKGEFATAASGKNFNQLYYQKRQFVYAWLAWLDGDKYRQPTIENKATYVVNIAGKQIQGSVFSSLKKRSQYLYKGKNLLHSMDVKALKNNKFIFNLVIQYKGVNAKNQKVIAKIKQTIHVKLKNNIWQIIRIQEKHLLPDIAPWIGFVC